MPSGSRRHADESLVAALASGMTVDKAAKRAGVSRSTATRRMRNRTFRQRVTEARAEFVSRALGRLSDSATEAADTLRALLSAGDDRVKLGAARAVLELGVKLKESTELEARIAALENPNSERPHVPFIPTGQAGRNGAAG